MEINFPSKTNKIAERDKLVPSPEQRAAYLWAHVQLIKPTLWDLICFSTEVLAIASIEHEFLQDINKKLVSVVYTAHYYTETPIDSCLKLDSQGQPEPKTSEQESSTLTK